MCGTGPFKLDKTPFVFRALFAVVASVGTEGKGPPCAYNKLNVFRFAIDK